MGGNSPRFGVRRARPMLDVPCARHLPGRDGLHAPRSSGASRPSPYRRAARRSARVPAPAIGRSRRRVPGSPIRSLGPAPPVSTLAIEGGRELEIAALFVDLRESTRLATGRLPYDALFLFDRYIQAVTAAVRQKCGHVTSIAGDGVMSVFGAQDDVANAAPGAWKAALQIWSALDRLNEELAGELEAHPCASAWDCISG